MTVAEVTHGRSCARRAGNFRVAQAVLDHFSLDWLIDPLPR
ncbi:hypothetical protein [Dactylosporangium fulvum]|uniref:Uncharacterized protein n=1 Tax=Dactylosporangium fulvum TaxID=53359 RepID=A0ABY5VZM8_9ACTN|nr:hypothetical protein [Dactylosporangium fulvum]UWP83125.1 hypothetical protein Dfulv_02105 [Dactylosporangium fulvum]